MTDTREGTLVTDDGAPLWYRTGGVDRGAPPALLLDGLGCDGFVWRYLWGPLTAARRVLHFNYRGHGRSGVPRDDTRIGVDYVIDDAVRLLDHAGLDRAVVFGHSMGVQMSLELHRRRPDRGQICSSRSSASFAHSKGASDARYYLNRWYRHGKPFKILSLYSLGTPSQGTILSDIAVAADAPGERVPTWDAQISAALNHVATIIQDGIAS